MVKEIVRDPLILRMKSTPATKEDLQTAMDLLETVTENSYRCVGMAANMIGVHKRILVALIGKSYQVIINPVVLSKSAQTYEAEEGCLSLEGVRKVRRHRSITIEYLDINFRKKRETFRDFEAQIIQHEMDHFEGIII